MSVLCASSLQAMHLTAEAISLRPSDFYSAHDIQLMLGKEVSVVSLASIMRRFHSLWSCHCVIGCVYRPPVWTWKKRRCGLESPSRLPMIP